MTSHPADAASPILMSLAPVSHDLGGFKVHRTLPHRQRTMVGPFIFFDQMGPARLGVNEGIDVRPHPHINLATVTYLFEGAIDHRDSLGTVQRIEPGAVNLMTAGRGISHSERSPTDQRAAGPVLDGIQTWLALPRASEEVAPAFEHVAADRLPQIEGDGVRLHLIMGEAYGARSPVTQCPARTRPRGRRARDLSPRWRRGGGRISARADAPRPPRPRPPADPRERARRPADAVRRRPDGW